MHKYLVVDPKIRAKRSDLLDEPVVIRLKGSFNEEMADKFAVEMAKAHETGQAVVPIILDSFGGEVYTLLDMISQIQSSRLPVATIVEGKAMSAAAMLFCFGWNGHRYMAENATLMIHDVSSGHWGKIEEIKADAKETERLHKLIFTMLAKHMGKKDSYFLDIIHEKGHAEWYLTAKEAKKHGLCNHIGVPEYRVEIGVSHKFGLTANKV